jgi:D-lactate dehydrogenase
VDSQGCSGPLLLDAVTLGIVDDVGKHLDPERRARHEKIRVLDSLQWCLDLIDDLHITGQVDRIVLHPTCSMTHLGLTPALQKIAGYLGREVDIPLGATCCGTAGDRGLLHPELVISATRDERASLEKLGAADAYLSDNRTCEMGMRHVTGRPYESFIFLLEELSRPP